MTRLQASYKAFREPAIISDPLFIEDDFDDWDNRRLRYAINWSFYENSAYRDVHRWVRGYKTKYDLYRYIRNIYNPTYRLGEAWKSFIWGGLLDTSSPEDNRRSALPIEADNEDILEALGQIYRWSNWQVGKDILTLYGAVFGDAVIRVVDNVEKGKVYFEVVHPGSLKEKELDDFGNVKAYTIEEVRRDPRVDQRKVDRTVIYTEIVTREAGSDLVRFQTLLDGRPYAWNGSDDDYTEPYGFVPLVFIKHNDVGIEWGWSEMHPARSKIHEVDDLASKLSDQIRKMVDAPWLFSGVQKPSGASKASLTQPANATSQAENPHPGRAEIPAWYGPAGATATPLVAPLDIASTAAYIKDLMSELERDYPELQMDIWTAEGNTSGRALRIARQRIEAKVNQRRPNYDDGMIRAHNMALAIAGFRNLEGFGAFGLDSFARGDLNHVIGKRPVFSADPLDDIEIRRERAEALRTEFAAAAWPQQFGWRRILEAEGVPEEELDERIAEILEAAENTPMNAEQQVRLQMQQNALEQMRLQRQAEGEENEDET